MNLEDGIRIFADSLYRARGAAAEDYAKGRAADLARCGDWDGQAIWSRVAAAIHTLAASKGAASNGKANGAAVPALATSPAVEEDDAPPATRLASPYRRP